MIKYSRLSLALSVMLGIGTSQTGLSSTSEHQHKHHSEKKAKSDTKKSELTRDSKKQILAVFKANEDLHTAFYNFDATKIASKASEVSKAIEEIEDAEIKKKLTYSKARLEEMEASKSKEELAKAYHLVSMALIHILDNYDVGSDYKGFYCPMVKKKWVQNTSSQKGVENPYAKEMPKCGEKMSS